MFNFCFTISVVSIQTISCANFAEKIPFNGCTLKANNRGETIRSEFSADLFARPRAQENSFVGSFWPIDECQSLLDTMKRPETDRNGWRDSRVPERKCSTGHSSISLSTLGYIWIKVSYEVLHFAKANELNSLLDTE